MNEYIVNGEQINIENALKDYEEKQKITLTFIPIKEITYKPSNGFGTYVCELSNSGDFPPTFNMNGTFIRTLDIGQTYKANGEISVYRNEKQFKISDITKVMPTDKRGIISFLQSLDGLRFQAELIYEEYGDKSLEVMKEHPLDLLNIIDGSYPELVYDWKKQIDNLKNDYDALNRLMKLGIRSEQAKILYDKYGETIFFKLEENPYFILKEVRGYGFKKCDNIAKAMGIEINNHTRLSEGILNIIRDNENNGDTYIEKNVLIKQSKNILSLKMGILELKRAVKNLSDNDEFLYIYGNKSYFIPGELIRNCIKDYNLAYSQYQKEECKLIIEEISDKDIEEALRILTIEERIIIEEDKIFDKETYIKESNISRYIYDIHKNRRPLKHNNNEDLLEKYCKNKNIELEEKQKEAVKSITANLGDIFVINGGAGCGKTFCIKIALALLEEIYEKEQGYFSKMIIAPTGKASRVATKATGILASTIHTALKSQGGNKFYFNANNKLPYDCIIIDETSMLDTFIADALFSAIAPRTKVILMGDTNQLASIGSGNILHDIINSNKIKVTTLNVVKRQGVDSGIVINARNVIDGIDITSQKETKDSLIYKAETNEQYCEKMLSNAEKLINSFGLDEVQILTPQRTGITGVNFVNFLMQEKFNPKNNEIKILKHTFEVENEKYDLFFKKADKVINTKNNYSMPCYDLIDGKLIRNPDMNTVTNGETGRIVKLIQRQNEYGEWDNKIIVKFEDKYVIYDNDFDDLEHCYAMTIHKSQGSEWNGVILLLNKSHKNMLDKNLFYTGITRSKKINIILSDPETLKYGVRKNKLSKRKTDLCDKICKTYENE